MNKETIMERLAKISTRLSDQSFLSNNGLANEVGIHIFHYDPKDEMLVQNFFEKLSLEESKPFRLVERNLYDIFLSICEEKRILKAIPAMEQKKGSKSLLLHLQKIASPELFVEKMQYEPHKPGDVLLITGVGAVFPFIRAHKILNNIQHIFHDIPVLLLYPGEYTGQTLSLFCVFLDGNYYRAFNLI